MEESLTTEHSSELLGDSLEEFLDGCAVTNKGGGHLETTWWDVANSGLDVVGDPFNEVAAVLVLYVQHLFVDFLHGHTSTEHGGDGEISAVTWITGSHHVLGVEHLLGEFGYSESSVLLATAGGKWSEARHKEMETWEGYHVDSQFTEISVELARESETGGDSGHGGGDEMVQVTVGWGGEFQGSEADIVESLVVDTVGLVGVLNELVDRQGGVVGLDNGVGYLKNTKTNMVRPVLNIQFNPFMPNHGVRYLKWIDPVRA